MKINDGGPAFPVTACTDPGDAGMTLRDWFAGQVLAGIMAASSSISSMTNVDKKFAKAAYLMADAMIKARETPNE